MGEVLYIPSLAYNLLSVPKATEAGKTVTFGETQGEIVDEEGEVVAIATKTGSLYYLNCEPMNNQQINSVTDQASKNLWNRRYGHLGERNLSKLKNDGLVNEFYYDATQEINLCESCLSGKMHRRSFPSDGRERAEEPLGLIHSDVCGKISSPSLGLAEYFVIFIDDHTHYVWVYEIKHKNEVFYGMEIPC